MTRELYLIRWVAIKAVNHTHTKKANDIVQQKNKDERLQQFLYKTRDKKHVSEKANLDKSTFPKGSKEGNDKGESVEYKDKHLTMQSTAPSTYHLYTHCHQL